MLPHHVIFTSLNDWWIGADFPHMRWDHTMVTLFCFFNWLYIRLCYFFRMPFAMYLFRCLTSLVFLDLESIHVWRDNIDTLFGGLVHFVLLWYSFKFLRWSHGRRDAITGLLLRPCRHSVLIDCLHAWSSPLLIRKISPHNIWIFSIVFLALNC